MRTSVVVVVLTACGFTAFMSVLMRDQGQEAI